MPAGSVPNQLRQNILTEINSGKVTAKVGAKKTKRWAPLFQPHCANEDPYVMANNNCYNYATTKMTNTYAQPGIGSTGRKCHPITSSCVRVAAIQDGLRVVTFLPNQTPTPPPKESNIKESDWNLVALAVAPGW